MSEHAFQAWCDRFIDRVVLPPMFTTAIDVAASDMASIGRRSKLQGRGMKFGLPDLIVAQRRVLDLSCWLELKRGSKVSSQQKATHTAMRAAGLHVAVCDNMHAVRMALESFGFELHPNAMALAAEYEMRVVAKETAPRTPKAPSKPAARKSRATTVKIRRAHESGYWSP